MKKFLFALILVLCFGFNVPSVVSANSQTESYAQITNENVVLFKTPNESTAFENVWFTLTPTYFVLILDESDENFLFVSYQNFEGYVKKDCVTKVYGTPQTPFPQNITFETTKTALVVAKALPTLESETVGTLNAGATATFVGKTVGEQAIKSLGNEWFFAVFENKSGYVYAPLTENLSTIPENTEVLPTTPPVEPEPIISPDLTNPSNFWVIATLCFVGMFLFAISIIPFFKSKKSRKIQLPNQTLDTQTKV